MVGTQRRFTLAWTWSNSGGGSAATADAIDLASWMACAVVGANKNNERQNAYHRSRQQRSAVTHAYTEAAAPQYSCLVSWLGGQVISLVVVSWKWKRAMGGWKTGEMRRATVTSGRCWVERARVPGA
eukprot:scaffold208915_cov40-Cyclotella_meneghiniana.AAC.1